MYRSLTCLALFLFTAESLSNDFLIISESEFISKRLTPASHPLFIQQKKILSFVQMILITVYVLDKFDRLFSE